MSIVDNVACVLHQVSWIVMCLWLSCSVWGNRSSRDTAVGNRSTDFQVMLACVHYGTDLSCFSMVLFGHSRLACSSADEESRSKAVVSQAVCLSAVSLLWASSFAKENSSPMPMPHFLSMIWVNASQPHWDERIRHIVLSSLSSENEW